MRHEYAIEVLERQANEHRRRADLEFASAKANAHRTTKKALKAVQEFTLAGHLQQSKYEACLAAVACLKRARR